MLILTPLLQFVSPGNSQLPLPCWSILNFPLLIYFQRTFNDTGRYFCHHTCLLLLLKPTNCDLLIWPEMINNHDNVKFGIDAPGLKWYSTAEHSYAERYFLSGIFATDFQLFCAKLRLCDHLLWIDYITGERVLLAWAAWLIFCRKTRLTILIQRSSLQYTSRCFTFSQALDLALPIITLSCPA